MSSSSSLPVPPDAAAGAPSSSVPARPLTRRDYQTLALSALGGTLEFYDFVIYVFFATVLGALFFPADMPDCLRMLHYHQGSQIPNIRAIRQTNPPGGMSVARPIEHVMISRRAQRARLQQQRTWPQKAQKAQRCDFCTFCDALRAKIAFTAAA